MVHAQESADGVVQQLAQAQQGSDDRDGQRQEQVHAAQDGRRFGVGFAGLGQTAGEHNPVHQPESESYQGVGRGLGQTRSSWSASLSNNPPQRLDDSLGARQQQHQSDKSRAVDVPAAQRCRAAAFTNQGSIGGGDAPVGEPHAQGDQRERQGPNDGVEGGDAGPQPALRMR